MIIEWLMQAGVGIGDLFAGMFAPVELPAWVTETATGIFAFMDSASALGVWFPWQMLSTVVGGLLTFYLAMFAIQLIRAAAKHVPLVGGGG